MQAKLYESPIPHDQSNFRVVENRIMISASCSEVYDYVTTWSNLQNWLPMAEKSTVIKGESGAPAKLGDILYEEVKDEVLNGHTIHIPPKAYTVVAEIPSALWVVTGKDEGDSWTRWVAYFSTTPIAEDQTLFSRVFAHVVRDATELVTSVIDPVANQLGLERLKAAIERKDTS